MGMHNSAYLKRLGGLAGASGCKHVLPGCRIVFRPDFYPVASQRRAVRSGRGPIEGAAIRLDFGHRQSRGRGRSNSLTSDWKDNCMRTYVILSRIPADTSLKGPVPYLLLA